MFKNKLHFLWPINSWLCIAIGAVPGAWIRWQIQNDLIVNMVGAAFLGFLISMRFSSRFKLIFGVGFCGALTTFSSWILNCLELFEEGLLFEAFSVIFTSLFLGLLAAGIGFFLGRTFSVSKLL